MLALCIQNEEAAVAMIRGGFDSVFSTTQSSPKGPNDDHIRCK